MNILKNNMRLTWVSFIITLVTWNCENPQDLTSNAFGNGYGSQFLPFGQWQLVSYSDGKKVPYEVSLEIKNETDEKGHYIISGKSNVNFYFSTCSIDNNQKKIMLYGVGSTKISGTTEEIEFETNYYQLLGSVERYELSNNNNRLTLYLSERTNQYLVFSLI